jgi:hypothetical protein
MPINNKKPTHTLRCGNIKATNWQMSVRKGRSSQRTSAILVTLLCCFSATDRRERPLVKPLGDAKMPRNVIVLRSLTMARRMHLNTFENTSLNGPRQKGSMSS